MEYIKTFENYQHPTFYEIGSDEKLFIKYCKDIATDIRVHELDGWKRKTSEKSFEWVFNNINEEAHIGLKEIHTPIGKIFEWENGPYLEAFMRDTINGSDYFFFIIVDHKYLPELIEKFNLIKR